MAGCPLQPREREDTDAGVSRTPLREEQWSGTPPNQPPPTTPDFSILKPARQCFVSYRDGRQRFVSMLHQALELCVRDAAAAFILEEPVSVPQCRSPVQVQFFALFLFPPSEFSVQDSKHQIHQKVQSNHQVHHKKQRRQRVPVVRRQHDVWKVCRGDQDEHVFERSPKR